MPPRKIFVLLLLMLAAPVLRCQRQVSADTLLAQASKYIGTPYRWAGSSPKGFDCAGFTRYIYGLYGYSLPHSSAAQYHEGTPVERGQWQPGDLVFFSGRAMLPTVGHVGIVTEADSSGFRFIHSAVTTGIRISTSGEDYYAKRYIGARRLLPEPAGAPPAGSGTDTLGAEPDTALTVALVGDIMFGTTYPTTILPQRGGKDLLVHAKPVLERAHIAMGNLESVFCDTTFASRKQEGENSYTFRTPPVYASLLREAGFDFMCLANNHSFDFGTAGARSTMALLDSLGIGYAGLRHLCRTAYYDTPLGRVAVVAFGHNRHTFRHTDLALVGRVVCEVRDSCDLLFVSFHGGPEGQGALHLPDSCEVFLGEKRGCLRLLAHLCIDLGADLVHGHGPHVPRAMELYRGRLVAYSLGNFCTPVGMSLAGKAKLAPIVEVRLDSKGALIDGKIHSFVQPHRQGPKPDPDHLAARLIRSLSEEDIDDPGLDIDDDGFFRPHRSLQSYDW